MPGRGVIRTGKGTIRLVKSFLMASHPLTNFEIQKYYQNEPKLYDVYSRNKLPEIKDGHILKTLWSIYHCNLIG